MILKNKALPLLFTTLWLLSGCATQETTSTFTSKTPANWPAQMSALNKLQHWKITGKLGLRTKKSIDSAIINRWEQNHSTYSINLSSVLFGLGATYIKGNQNYLMIQRGNDDPVFSSKPDQLIESQTGWPLPLRQIPFWIKGVNAPGSSVKRTFTDKGLPASLEQDHWHITYSRFSILNGLPLPGKIIFQRDDFRLIFIIQKWHFIPKNIQPDY